MVSAAVAESWCWSSVVDVRRNYYADLELTSAATTDEIKRQFKKLGRIPMDVV